MAQLTGMAVKLTSASDDEEAGTNDHLYIGVVGSRGGREFPLNSKSGDINFPPGQTDQFLLGSVWEGGFTGALNPLRSLPGQDNDPAHIPLDLDGVNFVYLRKQGDKSKDDDEAYKLRELRVVLYGPATPSKRVFRFFNEKSLWLANEHGHVVYLHEIREAGKTV